MSSEIETKCSACLHIVLLDLHPLLTEQSFGGLDNILENTERIKKTYITGADTFVTLCLIVNYGTVSSCVRVKYVNQQESKQLPLSKHLPHTH